VLDEDSKQRVKELCDQIAKEQDRNRFSLLISELNHILESSGVVHNGRDGHNGNGRDGASGDGAGSVTVSDKKSS